MGRCLRKHHAYGVWHAGNASEHHTYLLGTWDQGTKIDVGPWEPATLKPTQAVVRRDHWSALKRKSRDIEAIRLGQLTVTFLSWGKVECGGVRFCRETDFIGNQVWSETLQQDKSTPQSAHNPRETRREPGLAEWFFCFLCYHFTVWLWPTVWLDQVITG